MYTCRIFNNSFDSDHTSTCDMINGLAYPLKMCARLATVFVSGEGLFGLLSSSLCTCVIFFSQVDLQCESICFGGWLLTDEFEKILLEF